MKQEHFMQALRRGLSPLPKNEVDEIVADYREYIADAVAAGRNEEEVVAALGDPLKLARELKAQASYRQWESHRSFRNLMRVVVAIAGLGAINFLLFFPFMIYLLLLTAGYVVSVTLMMAGIVMVIGAGGNKLFNWPHFHTLGAGSFSFASGSKWSGLVHGDQRDGQGSHHMRGAGGVQIAEGRFVFRLGDGEHANLVLTTGTPVTLVSVDGKVSVDSADPKVRAAVIEQADGGVSVARSDVRSLEIEDSEGENFSYVAGRSPDEAHWRVHSNDGDVAIDQDEKHGIDHVGATQGKNVVSIDNDRISIDDGEDHLRIGTGGGLSLIMEILLAGIGFMIAGALGLCLCVWMSRLTWRGLSRYLRYQISVVAGKESLAAAE